MEKNSRGVYSTETGDMRKLKLPDALGGAPADLSPTSPASPTKIKVVLDRKHRRGKVVTLITGIAADKAAEICKTLKALCGSGGTVEPDATVLIQGDHREKIIAKLRTCGFPTN